MKHKIATILTAILICQAAGAQSLQQSIEAIISDPALSEATIGICARTGDGRTLADMSGLPGGRLSKRSGGASWRDKWQTYCDAVKLMFLPMLCVIGALVVIYLLMYLFFLLM